MSETILEVQHLGKSFGNNEILKDIDFSVKPKDVTCIIGPSGSGKSTLLRCMNLLETPSCGEIHYHGTNIMDKHVNVPEYRSKVGMVFQNFNLFNNMTVLKNCTVGQEKVLKKSKEEAHKNAMMYLEKVGMAPLMQNRNSFPADRSRELRLREHLRWNRRSCSLMSQLPHWIRRWSERCWKLCGRLQKTV